MASSLAKEGLHLGDWVAVFDLLFPLLVEGEGLRVVVGGEEGVGSVLEVACQLIEAGSLLVLAQLAPAFGGFDPVVGEFEVVGGSTQEFLAQEFAFFGCECGQRHAAAPFCILPRPPVGRRWGWCAISGAFATYR